MCSIAGVEWRAIERFPGYEVSNLGRARSIPRLVEYCNGVSRRRSGCMLSLTKRTNGYRTVKISRRSHYIHRLVAEVFIGPIPDGKEINHIDGDKTNNRVDNLEFVTHKGNMRHARRIGIWDNRGELNGRAKASDEQVLRGMRLFDDGLTIKEAARLAGIASWKLSSALYGATWEHLKLENPKRKRRKRIASDVCDRVRAMYASGLAGPEIASGVGIGTTSVYRILKEPQVK